MAADYREEIVLNASLLCGTHGYIAYTHNKWKNIKNIVQDKRDILCLCVIHQFVVGLFLIHLVPDVLNVDREVCVCMEVDDVTHIRDEHTFIYPSQQIL